MNVFSAESFEKPNHEHYYECLKLKARLDLTLKIVGIADLLFCIFGGLDLIYVSVWSILAGGAFKSILAAIILLTTGGMAAYAFTEKKETLCFIAAVGFILSAFFCFDAFCCILAVATAAMYFVCKIYHKLEDTEGFPYFNIRQVETEERKQRESENQKTLRLMRERDAKENAGKEMPTLDGGENSDESSLEIAEKSYEMPTITFDEQDY